MALVAMISLAVLAYTYAGYPVLISILARTRPRRALPGVSFEPTVSVCISAYNAGALIERKLASTLALTYPASKLEVLVYSDGSTDDTDARVQAWAGRDGRVRLLRGQERLGKPTGLNRMREAATGDVLLLTDVRQDLESGALRALLTALAPREVGCVSGELVLRGNTGAGLYWLYEKWIRRSESQFRSTVGISGSIAAVRRADMPVLPPDILLDDMWIPMTLRLQGRLVTFCDDALAYDEAFDDGREFPRKVRTLAGNYQIFARLPQLLVPGVNPSWFETVSHKVLRLACPWALMALLVSSLLGARGPVSAAGNAMAALAGAQILFYAAAALGRRAGRLGGLGRTFVVLNAAAVLGLWKFLGGRQKITW